MDGVQEGHIEGRREGRRSEWSDGEMVAIHWWRKRMIRVRLTDQESRTNKSINSLAQKFISVQQWKRD